MKTIISSLLLAVSAALLGFTASAADSVAQDDAGNSYETLSAAFSGTAAGGAITLLKDCTVSSQISCSKNISLNLNKHQIDVSGIDYLFNVTGGDFYLTGPGTINAPKGVFQFKSSGTLTIDDIEMNTNVGATSSTAGYGNKFSSGKVVVTNLKGTTLYGSMFYFDGPCTGTFGVGNSVELIGYLSGMSNNNPYPSSSFGLANVNAKVTVEGGYYKSACYGAYILTSGGTFTMTGGTLEAEKTVLYYDGNANGSMSISGGQFKLSDKNCWLARAGHDEKGKVSITGGEFNVNPIENCYKGEGITPANVTKTTTFVAEGYGATPVTRYETETWYKVGLPPAVVDDEGNEYATLKAALDGVKAGGTITVKASCSLPSEAVKLDRSFTLDLNGQAIAVPSYQGSDLSFLASDTAATVVISNGSVTASGSTADTCFIECNSSKGKVVLADLTATVACNQTSPKWSPYPAFVRSSADGGVVEVVRCNFTATSAHRSPLLLAESGDLVVEDTTLDNSLATATASLSGAAIGIRGVGGSCVTLKGDCRFSRASGTTGAVVYDNGGGVTDDILAEPGTYNFDPSAWVDTAKYLVTGPDAKGIWTVEKKPAAEPVARIGGTEYETLGDAVTAAKAGDTIVLLKDVEIAKTITPAVSCTIDLGGKTVSAASTLNADIFSVSDAQLAVTIKNGSVSMSKGSQSSLRLLSVSGADVTLDGVSGTVFSTYRGVIFAESSAHLTIRNSSLTETTDSYTPVLYAMTLSEVDVIDSVLDASTQVNTYGADYCSAVYLWNAPLSVSGSKSVLKGRSNGGNAIQLKLTSTKVVITGGTFSQDPTKWVDTTNYEVVSNGNGTWTVKSNKPSDPLPDPSEVTTPVKVAEVMADAADSLKANVKTVEEYSDFFVWVEVCSLDHAEAKASKDSFFSFATAQNGIVDTDAKVTAETVKTVGIEPTADGVKLTVKIDDLPVGEAAQRKYLEKVFGAKGSDSLTGFAKENVQYVAETMVRTADGSVSFTVKPAEKFDAPSQFFFVGAVSPDSE